MNERLITLIEYLIDTRQVFNNTDFGDIIGKSKSQVSEMLSGKRPISERTVHLIASKFPNLNTSWLLTGEGEMLKSGAIIQKIGDNSAHNTQVIGSSELAVCQQKVEYLERLLEEKERMIQVLLEKK